MSKKKVYAYERWDSDGGSRRIPWCNAHPDYYVERGKPPTNTCELCWREYIHLQDYHREVATRNSYISPCEDTGR